MVDGHAFLPASKLIEDGVFSPARRTNNFSISCRVDLERLVRAPLGFGDRVVSEFQRVFGRGRVIAIESCLFRLLCTGVARRVLSKEILEVSRWNSVRYGSGSFLSINQPNLSANQIPRYSWTCLRWKHLGYCFGSSDDASGNPAMWWTRHLKGEFAGWSDGRWEDQLHHKQNLKAACQPDSVPESVHSEEKK